MTTPRTSHVEPSLLELYLLMCQRRQRLGGSKDFHNRISKSLTQDDDTFGMLDYVKKSGLLVKKTVRPGKKIPKKKMSLLERDISNIEMFSRPNSPDGSLSVSSSMQHSSLCDVIGPDVCEECRKNFRQVRFVENSLLRPALSLPDIYRPKFRETLQLRPAIKDRTKRRNQRRILALPSVHRKPVPMKHPITIVEEAQNQKSEDAIVIKKDIPKVTINEAVNSGRLTPTVGPISKNGELTQGQLYSRVINKHRKKYQDNKSND